MSSKIAKELKRLHTAFLAHIHPDFFECSSAKSLNEGSIKLMQPVVNELCRPDSCHLDLLGTRISFICKARLDHIVRGEIAVSVGQTCGNKHYWSIGVLSFFQMLSKCNIYADGQVIKYVQSLSADYLGETADISGMLLSESRKLAFSSNHRADIFSMKEFLPYIRFDKEISYQDKLSLLKHLVANFDLYRQMIAETARKKIIVFTKESKHLAADGLIAVPVNSIFKINDISVAGC